MSFEVQGILKQSEIFSDNSSHLFTWKLLTEQSMTSLLLCLHGFKAVHIGDPSGWIGFSSLSDWFKKIRLWDFWCLPCHQADLGYFHIRFWFFLTVTSVRTGMWPVLEFSVACIILDQWFSKSGLQPDPDQTAIQSKPSPHIILRMQWVDVMKCMFTTLETRLSISINCLYFFQI